MKQDMFNDLNGLSIDPLKCFCTTSVGLSRPQTIIQKRVASQYVFLSSMKNI